MTQLPDLETVDRDGAIREGMAELENQLDAGDDAGHTRSAVLRRAAVAGGVAVAGVGLFGLVTPALGARSAKQDRAILNYALTLEYLESAFYTDALTKGELSGEDLRFAQVVGRHENDHVTLLRGALGRNAVRRPRFDFKGTTADRDKFRATALVLEDTGVSAYGGQVQRILSPPLLVVAAQIHAVEARHAAWMADILDGDPAPAVLNPVLTMRQVLAAVGRTGFIVT